MSYQEKRNITSILTGAAILAAYCLYAFNPQRLSAVAPDNLKYWAVTMLIFIGIGVGASIVIQILFHILMSISIAIREKIHNEMVDDKQIEDAVEKSIGSEMVEDEMHKLIELKSLRVGFFIAGVGFVAALFSLVFNSSAVVMLNILFITFNIASLIEGMVQIYYYRKGI